MDGLFHAIEFDPCAMAWRSWSSSKPRSGSGIMRKVRQFERATIWKFRSPKKMFCLGTSGVKGTFCMCYFLALKIMYWFLEIIGRATFWMIYQKVIWSPCITPCFGRTVFSDKVLSDKVFLDKVFSDKMFLNIVFFGQIFRRKFFWTNLT
jgi:hypothetical protein